MKTVSESFSPLWSKQYSIDQKQQSLGMCVVIHGFYERFDNRVDMLSRTRQTNNYGSSNNNRPAWSLSQDYKLYIDFLKLFMCKQSSFSALPTFASRTYT